MNVHIPISKTINFLCILNPKWRSQPSIQRVLISTIKGRVLQGVPKLEKLLFDKVTRGRPQTPSPLVTPLEFPHPFPINCFLDPLEVLKIRKWAAEVRMSSCATTVSEEKHKFGFLRILLLEGSRSRLSVRW